MVGALPDSLFADSASAMDDDGAITDPAPVITCVPESFAAIPVSMLPLIGAPDATIAVTCSGASAPDCTFDVTVAAGAVSALSPRGFGSLLMRLRSLTATLP